MEKESALRILELENLTELSLSVLKRLPFSVSREGVFGKPFLSCEKSLERRGLAHRGKTQDRKTIWGLTTFGDEIVLAVCPERQIEYAGYVIEGIG